MCECVCECVWVGVGGGGGVGETHSYSIFFFQVGCLAGVVQDVCERTGCTVVLDMGSGLVSEQRNTY